MEPVAPQVVVAPDPSSQLLKDPKEHITPELSRSGVILLIAPAFSYRVSSYINAAKQLNYQILLVSDSKHSLVTEIAQGITIDFNQPQAALKTVLASTSHLHIHAVIGTDDKVISLSSQIAESLGLAHNSPQAAQLTVRKDLARLRLKQHDCNVPDFTIGRFEKALQLADSIHYPVVIKPLMLSGSRGVIRANDDKQFLRAVEILKSIVNEEPFPDYEREHFLIEEFLEGDEIALDAFMQNGKILPLALFEKPEPLNGPYFEESFYITPTRYPLETQQDIWQEVERCCQAYGLTHGPIHAEARLTAKGVVLLEMASRTIGGQCAQLLEYSLGKSLEEVIIQLMCMQDLALTSNDEYAGVLMIPIPQKGLLKRIEGTTEAQKVRHITSVELFIQPGYELVPLPYGSSYLGFIFARSKSFDTTLEALKQAHSKLRFITGQKWTIESG